MVDVCCVLAAPLTAAFLRRLLLTVHVPPSLHTNAASGSKKGHAGHHAPTSGPHAGDKKSKGIKGSGATKKGACWVWRVQTATPTHRVVARRLRTPQAPHTLLTARVCRRGALTAGGGGGKFTWGSLLLQEEGVSALDRCVRCVCVGGRVWRPLQRCCHNRQRGQQENRGYCRPCYSHRSDLPCCSAHHTTRHKPIWPPAPNTQERPQL
jgi:hypothetical protein